MHRRTNRPAIGRVMIMVLAAALVASSLVAATARADSPTGQGPVTTTLGGFETDVVFNDPLNDSGRDSQQLTNLIRLINGVPAGGEIDMALFSISANIVYDAIKAAHDRGVIVKAVQNGSNRDPAQYADSTPRDVAALLGGNNHWCDHGSSTLAKGSACISTDSYGIAHAKYMLFSATTDRSGALKQNVVWLGSPNETYASGTDLSNNAVTVYGDSAFYTAFHDKMWTPQFTEQSYPNNDFYVASSGRGTFTGANGQIKVYASPEQTTDLVANRLSYINTGTDCQVRVMQASLHDSRPEVIDKIVSLKKAACTVEVVAGEVDPDALASFRAAGIPVHKGKVHDKSFIISARYNDSAAVRPVILTGSHNITNRALKQDDELLVKVEDNQQVYTAYLAHFHDIFDHSPTY